MQEDGEGRGILMRCSPWGHKEPDMTLWLNNNKYFLKYIMWLVFGLFFNYSTTYHKWSLEAQRQVKVKTCLVSCTYQYP